MIKYALNCDKDHTFEAWFQNSAAFDRQAKRGLVACPDCGSIKVGKALMAPNISARTRKKGSTELAPSVSASDVAKPQRVASAMTGAPAELAKLLRKIRQEVEAKAEYVGPRFAEEARKIHYDEAPERGIYGQASIEEVRELHDEGIECLPLPELPEDHN
jgi:hypothetical protein